MPYLLTPLSWIYGSAVWIRNKMFDAGLMKQEEFDIPVVSVGNITVGGTGKTPFVEFIASALCMDYNIGIVSRGYKRKTKGFVLANSKSTPDMIGDEPCQMVQKLGHRVRVAVCEKRVEGIRRLREAHPEINLILLDDAFQHRYVRPKVSVLLMDYSRPVYRDRMLPLGRLRESSSAIDRADIVVVTKCPESLQPVDYMLVRKELALFAYQKLFFSRFDYLPLCPVFPEDCPYSVSLESFSSRDSVLLLTGIAQPRPFVRHFKDYPFKRKVSHFPDHHDFSRKDMLGIAAAYEGMKGEHKIIVTTEKDAVRLANNPYFPELLKPFIFYQPVEISVVDRGGKEEIIPVLRGMIQAAKV